MKVQSSLEMITEEIDLATQQLTDVTDRVYHIENKPSPAASFPAADCRVEGVPACGKGRLSPEPGSAPAHLSPLAQTFAKDAMANPSQKQVERLVRQLNKGTLDENEIVNIFSSRSERRTARASLNGKIDIPITLHGCAELRIQNYRFTRSNLHAKVHLDARTIVPAHQT